MKKSSQKNSGRVHNVRTTRNYGSVPRKRAWVVFSGQADLPWLKILKRGFRHCFVILHDGISWVTIDPMLHHMDVTVRHDLPADFDLPRWLRSRGNTVMVTDIETPAKKPAPLGLFTCVETVKRILGIRRRTIITPWQLYRHLKKQNKPM